MELLILYMLDFELESPCLVVYFMRCIEQFTCILNEGVTLDDIQNFNYFVLMQEQTNVRGLEFLF